MSHPKSVLTLQDLHVVLVKTRFPENVGMVARACVNMGVGHVGLADPELWKPEKARPLATAKGEGLLEAVTVFPDLPTALAPHALVVGTTARTGGWRRDLLRPAQAAAEVVAVLAEGQSVALVMGPEDRGLNNEEIECCQRLVTIPTSPDASSLNVAQATLLLLYECFKAAQEHAHGTRPSDQTAEQAAALARTQAAPPAETPAFPQEDGKRINAEDQSRLYGALKSMLMDIDFLHGNNPDYFLMPLRRFLGRVGLRRHEYDALMGVCRQVKNKLGK